MAGPLPVALDLIPVGRNLITIKGAHTGYFLAVGSQGEVYTTVSESKSGFVCGTVSAGIRGDKGKQSRFLLLLILHKVLTYLSMSE